MQTTSALVAPYSRDTSQMLAAFALVHNVPPVHFVLVHSVPVHPVSVHLADKDGLRTMRTVPPVHLADADCPRAMPPRTVCPPRLNCVMYTFRNAPASPIVHSSKVFQTLRRGGALRIIRGLSLISRTIAACIDDTFKRRVIRPRCIIEGQRTWHASTALNSATTSRIR
jgi:hypothetical protein